MIRRLSVRGFRNLHRLETEIESGATLLVGATGAGKTSLLEAVYLLATSKSFRTRRMADCLAVPPSDRSDLASSTAQPAGGGACLSQETSADAGTCFVLDGEIESGRRVQLGMGWSARGGLWRRVNGETASAAAYLEVLPAVAWSSAEGETLVGPPALRRRFLDRGVVATRPASIEVLSNYRRALEHKRRWLLTSGRSAGPRDESLAAWNEILAENGAEIVQRRDQYVDRLAVEVERASERSELGWPPILLNYRPSGGEAAHQASTLVERLANEEARERESQRPLVGPHLDRLEILWRGQPVRHLASAGERKAIGLLLLAGHTEVVRQAGREPILLLDDLDTELDLRSLAAISRALAGAGQRIISSNRPAAFEGTVVDRQWKIADGRIESF